MKWISRIMVMLALAFAAPALATVSSPTAMQVDQANGVTTSFAYNFLVPYQPDGITPAVNVIVTQGGVATTLNSSQYSITGVGSASGGTVTYPLSGAPLATGATVTILRAYPYTQGTSVGNVGFYPHTVEQVADNLEYQIQQLNAIQVANGNPVLNSSTFQAASDFGVSTTAADNSAAIMAIDTAGVVAVLKPGVYNVTHQIRFTHSGTGIRCASNNGYLVDTNGNEQPYPNVGCWLRWTGAGQPKNPDGPNGTDGTDGAMITFNAPSGPSNPRLKGNVLEGIGIDGNNGALSNAIQFSSAVGGYYRNVVGWNLKQGGTALDLTEIYPATLGELQPDQMNEFDNIFVGPYGGTVCIHAWFASFDRFSNIYCQTAHSDAIQLVGSDNLHFYNVVTYASDSTGTYFGVHFETATYTDGTGTHFYPSNSNTFWGLSGSVKSDGTSDPSSSGCVNWVIGFNNSNTCPFGNAIYQLDAGNGVPDPLVGTGGQLICTKNDGTTCMPKTGVAGNAGIVTQMAASMVIGDTYDNQKQAAAAAAPVQSGLWVRNTHEAQVVLEDGPDGSNNTTQWTFKTDQAGGPNANLYLSTNGSGYVRDFGHYTSQFQVGQIQDVDGYAPTTNTGACTGVGPVTGGSVAGKFTLTAVCSSQIHLVFPNAAAHGWVCTVQDTTTTAVTLRQVNSTSTTECDLQVLGASTGAADTMVYQAVAY